MSALDQNAEAIRKLGQATTLLRGASLRDRSDLRFALGLVNEVRATLRALLEAPGDTSIAVPEPAPVPVPDGA